MQLGVVGLGRMGANIVRRVQRHGHACVVYDAKPEAVRQLAGEGATGAAGLDDLVAKLQAPRAVWVMLPAGEITEQTVQALAALLEPGDMVIDGGNSFYRDDIRRSKAFAERQLDYLDVGTSGGVWGLERGYCMMVGGSTAAVERLTPILEALAPGLGEIPRTAGPRGPRPSAPSAATSTPGPAGPGIS